MISSRKGDARAREDSCVSVQRSLAGADGGSDGSGGGFPRVETPLGAGEAGGALREPSLLRD